MKKNLNNILLEAIKHGINLALDGFEDQDNDFQQLTHGNVKDSNITRDYLLWNRLTTELLYDPNITNDYFDKLAELSKKYSIKYKVEDRPHLNGIIKWVCQTAPTANLNWLDVTNITNMANLFNGYGRRFNGDISEWDVSHVTNMQTMFSYCEFNGDISNWDVSNVKNMRSMFLGSYYFNQDINNWDISNVSDLCRMFCQSIFNKPLNKWQPKSVEYIDQMFSDSIFKQDISNWRFEHLISAGRMFANCKNFPLEYVPKQVQSYWNTEYYMGN